MSRPPAQSFEDLVVWQKSHQVTLRVYRLTAKFPQSELYGLSAQMRRAAVSVAANIAEGFKKRGRTDKARVMNIAQGSLFVSFPASSFVSAPTSYLPPPVS